jgi:two-component system chemotaxis response regulator CheY
MYGAAQKAPYGKVGEYWLKTNCSLDFLPKEKNERILPIAAYGIDSYILPRKDFDWGAMKALIVEDSIQYRMLLKRVLQKAFGWDIDEAANGFEALAKLATDKVDVVFLDYVMPLKDGKETLKEMRANPALASLPVIMVTAHSDGELVHELLSYNISAYLVKPFSASDVIKHIITVFPKQSVQVGYF